MKAVINILPIALEYKKIDSAYSLLLYFSFAFAFQLSALNSNQLNIYFNDKYNNKFTIQLQLILHSLIDKRHKSAKK